MHNILHIHVNSMYKFVGNLKNKFLFLILDIVQVQSTLLKYIFWPCLLQKIRLKCAEKIFRQDQKINLPPRCFALRPVT